MVELLLPIFLHGVLLNKLIKHKKNFTFEEYRLRDVICFHAVLFALFDPEIASDMCLRNVSEISTDYAVLYPRR
jgi:hypothetical protein